MRNSPKFFELSSVAAHEPGIIIGFDTALLALERLTLSKNMDSLVGFLCLTERVTQKSPLRDA